jgi:hypothetical protein
MLRNWIATLIAVALVAVAVVAGVPSVAKAEIPPDYPIQDGHFFTQGSQNLGGAPGSGYSVTNLDGISFWDAYQSYGGVDGLGYPISRRFVWDDQVCQITEKAVLQWNATAHQVQLVNIFDELSRLGKDDWLDKNKRIPPMVALPPGVVANLDASSKYCMALLDEAPITRSFYKATTMRQFLYGLPRSKVGEYGVCYTVRFQRAALQVWQQPAEGHRQGEITVVPVGQILRDAGIFDASAFAPETIAPDPEASAREQRSGASRGGENRVLTGVATWYGADFQGSRMRNGEPYNMYDPTITASTTFPLESKLRVTSTATGHSVIVRVTDTGAFSYPLICDLSWAAFNQIADPGHKPANELWISLEIDDNLLSSQFLK